MKFVVSKDALLDGVQKIQNVVSPRATLPVLANALVEAGPDGIRLSTTDLEIGVKCQVSAEVEREGATTVPARRLAAIVQKLPSSQIVVECDSKNITTLTCGSSFFKIYGLPREEFPAFPSMQNATSYTLKQSTLRDGLRKTSYAISNDETRYVLNGIYFSFADNKLTMVATDGRRLALFDTDLEFPKSQERDFIVPTKAVNELARLLGEDGEAQIFATENMVFFRLPSSEMHSKLVEGSYPNYRQVIPGEAKERVKIEREALLNTVSRVSLLSSEKAKSVKLTFTKNNLDISANTPEVGEARESLPVAYKGRDMAIAFNPEYLMDPLRNLTDEEIYLDLIEEMSPGVIKINSPFLYVLMPMRVTP